MKFFSITLLFLCVAACSFAQVKDVRINGTAFTIISTSQNDTAQTEYVSFYRAGKMLLQHTLYKSDGDCSSENIELGGYAIDEKDLVFYTYWASGDRMGQYIYPYGFRKQVYEVSNNGLVNLKSSALYIETYIEDWRAHLGMKYLASQPKVESQKQLLKDYISKAEQLYHGEFVLGKARSALELEVRKNLKEAIMKNTSNWDAIYGSNCNK